LQVEHPVTELVTGFDLVREQISVANGARLSFTQEDVRWRGHAIECRVYAEDPKNNFLPSPGTISYLHVPFGPGVRDDSGVEMGSEVSIHYDPMISKLAAWGNTREESIDRLRRALDEYEISGIKTTLPFFREIVRDKEFTKGRLDTGFISRFYARRDEAMAGVEDQVESDIATIAAAFHYTRQQRAASANRSAVKETESRWKMSGRVLGHQIRDRQ
jgi:acetyl-CoA carboxylase biotin carboxylase subunit